MNSATSREVERAIRALDLAVARSDEHDATEHVETAPDPDRCAQCARDQRAIDRAEARLAALQERA
jgi:hypothetical protein